jgi:hypothetical protein
VKVERRDTYLLIVSRKVGKLFSKEVQRHQLNGQLPVTFFTTSRTNLTAEPTVTTTG